MRRTVPPSAEFEERIDRSLSVGVGDDPREISAISSCADLRGRTVGDVAVC